MSNKRTGHGAKRTSHKGPCLNQCGLHVTRLYDIAELDDDLFGGCGAGVVSNLTSVTEALVPFALRSVITRTQS